MVGHYGNAGALVGGLSIALLIVHVAFPFAYLDEPAADNDAGFQDQWWTRADAVEAFDDRAIEPYALSDPVWTLVGAILAAVGGLALIVAGLLPVSVTAARITGWVAGAVAGTGALFALTSSLLAVGAGFTTLLGVVFGNPHDQTRIWVLSPVLAAAVALAVIFLTVRVVAGVATTRDDLRGRSQRLLRGPVIAALFLVVVLCMPWALLRLDGAERRAAGECASSAPCEGTWSFHAAWGSTRSGFGGILDAAAATQDGLELWSGLAFGLEVMIAAAWAAFFLGLLASLGAVLASVQGTTPWSRVLDGAPLANVVTLPWATVHFALACIYQWRPSWDDAVVRSDQSWWFTFLPAVFGIAVLAAWWWQQVQTNWATFHAAKDVVRAGRDRAHSFD